MGLPSFRITVSKHLAPRSVRGVKFNFLDVAWLSLAVAGAELGVASFSLVTNAMPHLGSVGDPWQLTALGVRFFGVDLPCGALALELLAACRKGRCVACRSSARFPEGKPFCFPQILLWAQCLLIPVENQSVVSPTGAEPLLRQGGESSSGKALKISQIIKENVFPLEFNRKAPQYFGVSQLLYILLHGVRYPSPSWWDWEPAQ